MADVHFRGVKKEYPGGFRAIHGIDLDIADGAFVVLVGPSGCGKSTLLRMVAGLEEITEGEVRIGGRVVNRLEPAERDIAMVFQNYALYPHMTVFDNMAYGLRNRRTAKPEIERRVREAAAILGLSELLDRRPRQLSGGQRQRVAMGRAIVRNPQVFLFDEPLSNLDAKLRVQMRLEIKGLQRRLGTTSIYVTHDQVEAMTLGERLVVMNAGRAEQVGAPIEVYEKPQTTFVAAFIGSPAMNFFPGRIAPGQDRVVLAEGVEVPLANAVAEADAARPVTVGIRPEHIEAAAGKPGTDHLAMRVELVETLGADSLLHGPLVGADAPVTVRAPGYLTYRSGETVPLAVAPDRIHLFDAASGRRLAGS